MSALPPIERCPKTELPADSRMKVHLRLLDLGGRTFHVITLRPDTRVRFSTNFYHNTWHLVSDQGGSRLLARLLWGLAYQRTADTLILVHGPHLQPTPFEGERSDPFVLAPAHLTRLDDDSLRLLKARLPRLGSPTQTIRWQTFGLDAALRKEREDRYAHLAEWNRLRQPDNRPLWKQERMGRRGGFICYTSPPPILRLQALQLHRMWVKDNPILESQYHFLAEQSACGGYWADGEVQIFADYRQRVSAAVQARQQTLANPNQPVVEEAQQVLISRRRDHIQWSRRPRRA